MRAGRPSRAAGRRRNISGAASGDPIRIVVAVRAVLDREGIVALLRSQPDFEVAGCTGTSQEVIALCLELRPRILVLGALVAWPKDVDGVSAIRLCSPETRVVILAPHAADRCAVLNPPDSDGGKKDCPIPSGNCIQSALTHGAVGAVYRDVSPGELFEAVRAGAKGCRRIVPGNGVPVADQSPLSARERAVASMIGRGISNKDIGASLGISEGTVKKHVGRALRKLGLHDRLQLGLFVIRHPLAFEPH